MAKCIVLNGQTEILRVSDEDAFQFVFRNKKARYVPKGLYKSQEDKAVERFVEASQKLEEVLRARSSMV